MRKLALALLLIMTLTGLAVAAPTDCPQHFIGGQAPDLLNEKLAQKAQAICYQNFGLLHSGITRTPLYSAEHLTRGNLETIHPERKNAFHPDPNLPRQDRAELDDYARSGFDRGHMAPSADMPDEQSQFESFSLGNMIPQAPDNNRNLWEGIEATVRTLAKREGELFVVSGPIFYGPELQRLNGRVLVPTFIFKAIYDPAENAAAAYVVPNQAGDRYAVVSIPELIEITGITPFPDLPREAKALRLPAPRVHSKRPAIEDEGILSIFSR